MRGWWRRHGLGHGGERGRDWRRRVLRCNRERFRRPGYAFAAWFGRETRGGGGVLIGVEPWARGLGFGRGGANRTSSEGAVTGPVSSKTMSDRWAPPVSILNAAVAYRFGRAGLVGWADFGVWAEDAPAACFLIFFARTFFLFSF
jgi:hypothetical protein